MELSIFSALSLAPPITVSLHFNFRKAYRCAISGYPLQRSLDEKAFYSLLSVYSVKEGEWLLEDNVQFPF